MNEPDIFGLSGIIEGFKEGREEALKEQKARQLDYQSKLIEKFNYSPREFYVLLAKSLEERRVPGLAAGLVKMFESVVGSSKRVYMTVSRERFVYYVCAAPFGSGFFFSWRLVDERRPGAWYHVLATLILIGMFSMFLSAVLVSPLIRLLEAVGFDSLSLLAVVAFSPAIFYLLVFLALWSVMRCASIPGYEQMASIMEKVPIIGRVFERYYRPDTYYRQDTQKMYQKVFDHAINETISAITTPQGLRQRDIAGAPAVSNLHDK